MRRKAPPRQPHPDAVIEAELQRIISLRKVIARKEDLLARDHEQIAAMRKKMADHPTFDGHRERQQQIGVLLAETQMLEAGVVKLHDEIAARIGAIHDSDLAWLEGVPS